MLSRVDEGDSSNKIYIDHWKRIERIVQQYDDYVIMDYVRAIADNILF